jgi:pimeloyl-ACP methyl ester carboxylesterase
VLGACAPGGGTGAPLRGARSSTTSAPPPPSSSTSAPTTTTTVPEPPVTPVQWTACGALLCGSVAVPIDYDHPQSGTITIALAMHRATDPAARIGSLVIDPGGPGVSGVSDLPAELGVLTPQLLARFDIVEFDPRGVARSSPVLCSAAGAASSSASTPGPLLDPVPSTPAAQLALIAGDEAYAAACKAHSGTLLPFVGTVDAARDLDRIRQALGDQTLTYFGHSYGTLLGAVYADMFPTHVRAMVLDGAIDPAMSTEQMVVEQSEGFEAVLDNFLSWCTSTRCPWQPPGGDSAAALLALIAQSRSKAIPAGPGRSAGPGALYYAVLSALYTTSSWPVLGRALAEAAAGNGTEALSMADGYVAPSGSANAVDAETAIDCLDHPLGEGSSSIPALAAAAAANAPFFGPLLAWGEATCAVWPVPATRTPAPTTAVGSPPILVVGATKDPATPYVWAQRLAAELQHGELVTWQGENHVAYYYSGCIRAIDQAYFVAGTLPAPGTVCTD